MLAHAALELFSFTMILAIAATAFGVVEKLFPAVPYPALRAQTSTDLAYGYIGHLLVIVAGGAGLALIEPLITAIPIGPSAYLSAHIGALPFAAQLLIALVVLDLSVYIRHRFMHERLWSFHAIHHSAKQVTWLTKYRLHPIEILIAMAVTSLMLYMLGIDAGVIVWAQMAFFIWDLLNHANIKLGLPAPYCYVLATPNYHKWHHAIDARALNKNYVIMFPWIDRLFGTYYYPGGVPARYGLFDTVSDETSDFPEKLIPQLGYPFTRTTR